MNYKDYYNILGVAKNATQAEIKKAYRKLAVKYHPDKTKGDKTASERFMEINEANQVLSDPEKRTKYDSFGADWKNYEAAGAQQGGFDWSKYANSQGAQNQRMNHGDFESAFGQAEEIDLFELLFGMRSGRKQGRTSAAFKGEDLNAETTLSLEEAYHGTVRIIKLNGQTIQVTIPPGIADGQVLRIGQKGMDGTHGGPRGDLYLNVTIAQDIEFVRKGNDLHRRFPVDLYTAILGGKALVKTFTGAVKVDVPKETPNQKVLRLRGLGMPVFNKKGSFGDMFVTIDIVLPEHITATETEMFEKLAMLRK